MSALGKEVRRKRVEKHMSIGDLAEATGAHPNMISRIERGYIPATGVWIPAIEKALDVSSGLFGRAYESDFARSEERRVGKECASMCRSRWSPYH